MGKGFDTFMENPYWKGMYENAPSAELKEYYQIMFDTSPFVMGADYNDEAAMAKLEEIPLVRSDIEYLLEHAGPAQAKALYQRAIDVLVENEDAEWVYAIAFRGEMRNPWYTPA